jgi:hypothetical protein
MDIITCSHCGLLYDANFIDKFESCHNEEGELMRFKCSACKRWTTPNE